MVLSEKEYCKKSCGGLEGKHWNNSTILISSHISSLANMMYKLALDSVSLFYLNRSGTAIPFLFFPTTVKPSNIGTRIPCLPEYRANILSPAFIHKTNATPPSEYRAPNTVPFASSERHGIVFLKLYFQFVFFSQFRESFVYTI